MINRSGTNYSSVSSTSESESSLTQNLRAARSVHEVEHRRARAIANTIDLCSSSESSGNYHDFRAFDITNTIDIRSSSVHELGDEEGSFRNDDCSQGRPSGHYLEQQNCDGMRHGWLHNHNSGGMSSSNDYRHGCRPPSGIAFTAGQSMLEHPTLY